MIFHRARPALLIALLSGMAGLAACHPKPLREAVRSGAMHVSTSEPLDGPVTVAARLTCPQDAGDWTRTAAAADGAACSYTSPKGVLDLALVSGPPGDPAAALAPERARLDALMPSARTAAMTVESRTDAQGRKVANVDMPFLHVRDDGAHKSVKILGFSVDKTDGPGDRDEDDDAKPARPGAGTKLVYLLAGADAAPGGYHAVGYEARGDASGRLVVASFKLARGGEVHSDGDDDDGMGRLLAINAPGAGTGDDQP